MHSNSTESDWHTVGDALPVRDAATGRIHLAFTIDNLDVFYTASVDDGASWAAPTNISSAAQMIGTASRSPTARTTCPAARGAPSG